MMRSAVRVKICGLRSAEAAAAAMNAGADLLGFNFAPVSRRRVDPATARQAIAACRAGASGDHRPCSTRTKHPSSARQAESIRTAPAMVGIFVNQPVDEVASLVQECALDYVQLSGDEDTNYCRNVVARTGKPVIKVVRLTQPGEAERAAAYARGGVAALLADAAASGVWGGSGQAWDWSAAAALAARYRLLLAGGLTCENVAAAVAAVRPWGVDVASGVETDGLTDARKVRAFIQRVKGASAPGPAEAHRPDLPSADQRRAGGLRTSAWVRRV